MIRFPFFNMQELNLDWMMEKLKALLKFIPQNGSAGDVLQRTYDGAVWQPIAAISMDINSLQVISDVHPADAVPVYDDSAQGNYKALIGDIIALAPVQSVNGQTGDVVLDADDVGALPDSTSIPTDTADLTNGAGFVDAAGAAAAAPVQSVNGQTGDVVVTTVPFSMYMKYGQQVTPVVDTSIDSSNDCVINATDVYLEQSETGDVVLLSGSMKFTSGSALGWRTFAISGLSYADMDTGTTYVQVRCGASLYRNDTEWKPVISNNALSLANYRYRNDKSIHLYVYVGATNTEYMVDIRPIPVQLHS